MKTKILTLAVLAALYSTGSMAAPPAPPAAPAAPTFTTPTATTNQVTSVSTGSGNTVNADQQVGSDNISKITQLGDSHLANTVQTNATAPSNNSIDVIQGAATTDASTTAQVKQSGASNQAYVQQLGDTGLGFTAQAAGTAGVVTVGTATAAGSVTPLTFPTTALPPSYLADINQVGSDNRAVIQQTDALNSTAAIFQDQFATNANATIVQTGATGTASNAASIAQGGTNNGNKTATTPTQTNILQDAASGANAGNIAVINQLGDDQGSGTVATAIYQTGTDNQAIIDQTATGSNNGNGALGTTIYQDGSTHFAAIVESGTAASNAQVAQYLGTDDIAIVTQGSNANASDTFVDQSNGNANQAYVNQAALTAASVAEVTQFGGANYTNIAQ